MATNKSQKNSRALNLFSSKAGPAIKALLCILFNVGSASAIVFANKAVFAIFQFNFLYALTLLHTLVTMFGMQIFCAVGMFEKRQLPVRQVLPIAASFVAYIVLCNLNLKMNSVSFYQISKIAVAPAVLAVEAVLYGRRPSVAVAASVLLTCVGIAFATVSELEGSSGVVGALVGGGAVLTTALYQVWVGAKQSQLGAGSMQLLHASAPLSSGMLLAVVLAAEPLSPSTAAAADPRGTLLGYPYTPAAVAVILLSAVLGLAVSLSTFLVIGVTSSLTYNVVGHVKSAIIISGGVLLFGEPMPAKKALGLGLAMAGIVAYSFSKLREGTLINGAKGGAVAKGKAGGTASTGERRLRRRTGLGQQKT